MREESNYQVAILCGGIGASIIGYKDACMNVNLSIDSNEDAIHVASRNFWDVNLFWQTMNKTKGEDIRLVCGEKVDILDVSIPYKHLEHKTEKRKESEDFLLNVMRIIYETQAKVLVIHFDGRLNKGRHRRNVNEWLELVSFTGYDMHIEDLNATNYGIPHDKTWTVVIGVRQDIGIKPMFPASQDQLVTVKDVILDLQHSKEDVPLSLSRKVTMEKYFPPLISYREVKEIVNKEELSVHPYHYRRDAWDTPLYALNSTPVRPLHPVKNRLLTLDELKRIQTFPDNYQLSDNAFFDWVELASSIPPWLIKLVAESIKKDILDYL